MTSQGVERTWIRTGGYGRFRGEWVNFVHVRFFFEFPKGLFYDLGSIYFFFLPDDDGKRLAKLSIRDEPA